MPKYTSHIVDTLKVIACLLLFAGNMAVYAEADGASDTEKDSSFGDSIFLPVMLDAGQADNGVIAVPNPVKSSTDKVALIWRTRCPGTALVTIYDAVGQTVHSVKASLQQPDAVGYITRVKWDLRNKNRRLVGKGTYHGVIRIFDMEDRLVARKTVNIGVAYEQ
jgi:hypothetical protein